MLAMQVESIQNAGQNLTPKDFSEQVLGVSKRKGYLRGFGVGPKSFQSSSKSGAVSKARDEEVEKLRIELDEKNKECEREREEQQRKFEEQARKIEEQQKTTEEQQRLFEEQQSQFEEHRQQMKNLQTLVGMLLQNPSKWYMTNRLVHLVIFLQLLYIILISFPNYDSTHNI